MRTRVLFLLIAPLVTACGSDAAGGKTGDGTTADTGADSAQDTAVADSAQDTAVADSAQDTAVADSAQDTAVADSAQDTSVADSAQDTAVADTATDTTSDSDTAPSGCATPDDCTNCVFGSKVTSADDCYCLFCPSIPLSKAQCDENRDAWQALCDPWPKTDPCPMALCIPVAPPLCEPSGECVADPNGCFATDQCGSCRFRAPPESAADCACPTCPVPLATDFCSDIELTIEDVCRDFDFGSCPVLPCPFPPPIECTDAGTCGYGDLVP